MNTDSVGITYRCRHCYAPLTVETYIFHIKKCHTAFGYDEEAEDATYNFTNWTDSIFEDDATFYDDYLFFDGNYFLSSGIIKDGILHEWISLIGTEEDAKKYHAKLCLQSQKFEVPRIEWTVPVMALTPRHDLPDLRCCSAVPVKQTLRKFLSRNSRSDQGEVRECVWKQLVKMIKQ